MHYSIFNEHLKAVAPQLYAEEPTLFSFLGRLNFSFADEVCAAAVSLSNLSDTQKQTPQSYYYDSASFRGSQPGSDEVATTKSPVLFQRTKRTKTLPPFAEKVAPNSQRPNKPNDPYYKLTGVS